MPTLSATPVPAEETPETGLKEKKHKASKRSRHGPGRLKGSRVNKEAPWGPALLPAGCPAGWLHRHCCLTLLRRFPCQLWVWVGLASRTWARALPSLSLESFAGGRLVTLLGTKGILGPSRAQ